MEATTTATIVKKSKTSKATKKIIRKPKKVFLPAVWRSDRLARPACTF